MYQLTNTPARLCRLSKFLSTVSTPSPKCAFSRRRALSSHTQQNRLPASYYRGGTSRAIIFQQTDLPSSREDWAPIFLGVLGSPDPNGRQLDGLGGGLSSLSKICIVGPPSHPEADVDYRFAAIGVKDSSVDFSSNCGNMTAAIGPFAMDKGLVERGDGQAMVRIHNTNTGKIIHSRFWVEGGEAVAQGGFAIDGVAGMAAKIELSFVNPAGSKTGKLLPTGRVVDVFDGVVASCIDVGNPCVFVHADDIGLEGTILPDLLDTKIAPLARLEDIRRQASVAMGISPNEAATPGSIPKIAMVSRTKSHTLLSGQSIDEREIDLVVRAISVGQPHRAVPITVALALAAAANIEGSTVQQCCSSTRADQDGITLGHPSGRMVVGAKFDKESGSLIEATVFRTARRLMDGIVYWK